MADLFDDKLPDRIYEAAVVPELWPDVLGEMSRAVDGAGGILFTSYAEQVQGITSADIKSTFEEFLRDGWAAINPRPLRLGAANYAGFVRDNDFFTDEELDNEPVYRDFYRKRGLGWAAGTMLDTPSGDSIIFSFERAHEKGPVPLEVVREFDKLRPHLARSALLSSRLGLERAKAMADALSSLGLPAAVLQGAGRLSAANPLFEDLMPALAQDRRERLCLADMAADGLLGRALLRATIWPDQGTVNSIPIAATEVSAPMILHLLPVCGSAQDFFSQARFLLVITPVDRAVVPTAKVLQGLFDLTPAEARIAKGIGEAQTLEYLALTAGVSVETVRSQLKAVLSKTGLTRQQELVSLLAGKVLPATPPKAAS
ncbi:helix-turn-helix transcriptional regulator [Afipia sp. TerB]